MVPSSLRAFLAEPAVANPPERAGHDWVLLAIIAAGAVTEAAFRTDVVWRPASLLLCLAVAPTVLWRRTHPLATTVIGFASVSVFSAAAVLVAGRPAGLDASAFLLILPYALFRWGRGRDAGIGASVMAAAWLMAIAFEPGALGDAVGGLVVLIILAQLGALVRYRGAAQNRALEEAKLRERERLARELHDSVAHYLSAIAVQAQAGRVVAATRPDAPLEALGVIEEAASRALEEVRVMVGALRAGSAVDLAPQQRIADIARLRCSTAGRLRVDVELSGELDDVAPMVHAAVYRIAQESVTNAARHARNASHVRVVVIGDARSVRVGVHDDGEPVLAAPGPSGGYGLQGMRERAKLVGGTLTAGPGGAGGWSVEASIPRSPSS